MDFKIKELPKSEVEIKITVPVAKMIEYKEKACAELSKEVDIKGFRKGNVPADVLEKHLDANLIKAQTEEMAIQQSYAHVVIKEKLHVVARPKIKIETQEPFSYTATVAVLPKVEVKDYKSIKVKKKDTKVTDKDIEVVIEDLKKYGTVYKDVDRAAKKGDRAEVDFEGFDEKGKSVESTKSANHPVILGEGSLIPGFEEKIVGMNKDEEIEFDITFPKDYAKEDFRGKTMKFKLKLNRIEEAEVSELNEELIEKMTGKKMSVEEFKKDVEQNVKAKKETESKQDVENQYVEALLEKVKVELPEALVDDEVEHILHEMRQDIEGKGMEFDKFLEQAKITTDELKKKYRTEAEKRIKIRLGLRHIIEEEGIKVSPEDMEKEKEKIKTYYPKEQHAKIDEDFKKGELSAQVENRLALRMLFEKVLA